MQISPPPLNTTKSGVSLLLRFIPLLTLLCGLSLTFLSCQRYLAEQQKRVWHTFTDLVTQSEERIENRLKSYQQVLEDTASLLTQKPDLDDAAFKAHVERLQLATRFPGTQGIGFTRALTPQTMAEHLARQQTTRPWFDLRPKGERAAYGVVTFMEPLTPSNRKVVGVDLMFDAERGDPLIRSRDSGQVAVSGRLVLVQDLGEHQVSGVLIAAPVYAYGAAVDSLESRRRHILGWAAAPLRITDLLAGTLANGTPPLEAQIRIRVFDVDQHDKAEQLFESQSKCAQAPLPNAQELVRVIPFGGRTWRMEFTALPCFQQYAGLQWPYDIALLGTLGSLLTAAVLWLIINGRNNALRLAQQMTGELRESKELFQAVIEGTNNAVFVKDSNGYFRLANQTMQRLLGERAENIIGRRDTEIFPPDMQARFQEDDRRIMHEQQLLIVEHELRIGGQVRTLQITKGPLKTGDGQLNGIFGIVRDITEQKRVEAQLELAACVFQAGTEGVVVCDLENRAISINRAFTELTGYTPEDMLGQPMSLLKSGRQDDTFYQGMWDAITRTGKWEGEIWNKRKNGEIYPEYLRINTLYDENGQISRRFGVFSDITQQKKAQDLIWHQANYDALTDLPNRRLFRDRLQAETRRAHRNQRRLAILFIDLDHFKDVNDSLGHDQGDQLLIEAARRILGCVRDSDTVARMGGDEFVITLLDVTEVGHATRVAQALLAALAQPFPLQQGVVYITASIGITIYPDDAEDDITLIQNADQAMYAAKAHGRNGFSFFTQAMQTQAQTRLRLATDLRQALDNGQLNVHFQPVMNMTERLPVKAEALLRWKHPELGHISPATFIPIAEETGLIIEIGDWVFRQAAEFVMRWREQRRQNGLSENWLPKVSVNMSPQQFLGTTDVQAWARHLESIGVPRGSLIIEITEGLLLERNPCVQEKLSQLHQGGIALALDDFGTGYSAMSYLKKFSINYLKIDQSFIRDMETDPNDQGIVEAIILMAHKLGIAVIGEGVEREGQLQMLALSRCDFVQGYLFSRPLPAEEFLQRFAGS